MIGKQTAEQAIDDLNLLIDKLGGVGPGKGGVARAARLMCINISTIKRYRNGNLTIPQSRAITISMMAQQDPLTLKSMSDDVQAGRA